MEIAFEYSLRTLYEANNVLCIQGKEAQQYTLLDLMALLTDESFCHALLEEIEDLFIRRWWASYYDPSACKCSEIGLIQSSRKWQSLRVPSHGILLGKADAASISQPVLSKRKSSCQASERS